MASERGWRALTAAFFLLLIALGWAVHQNYGISWDELFAREYGFMALENRVPDRAALQAERAAQGVAYERFGPFYEMALAAAEKLARPGDIRDIVFLRHFLNFLMFVAGLAVFRYLAARRFGDGWALLGCLFFALTPQFFSHAFYNTKDISFLTLFALSMAILLGWAERPTWTRAALYGLVTAALIATRVMGVLAVPYAAGMLLMSGVSRRRLAQFAFIIVVAAACLPLFWPVLRVDPAGLLKDALFNASSGLYNNRTLYDGRYVPSTELPWHYLPLWMLITTPPLYLAPFLAGAASAVREVLARPAGLRADRESDLLVLLWFFVPVAAVVAFRPSLYDGWRHLFFIYPAFLYLAVGGCRRLLAMAVRGRPDADVRRVKYAAAAVLAVGLAPSLLFMVRSHPYEHLYFNGFAGKNMAAISRRFEMDYWGLSYRKALEYIVRNDASPKIMVYATDLPGSLNAAMIRPEHRKRLFFVSEPKDAEYFITTFRLHREGFPFPNEVYSVSVGEAKIVAVYRRPF